jgi:class 3 adenylate cyclase/CHASE2 domain-containing sensor protein
VTPSKAKLIPYAIALGVIAFVGFLQSLRHWSTVGDGLERLEGITYDWRQTEALKRHPPCATNLGFVYIEDEDIRRLEDGMGGALDYQFGLYWPRQVYGRLVNELKAEGARLIAFDVLFSGLRVDHAPVLVGTNPVPVASDEFLADQLRSANNAAIATSRDLLPHRLFRDSVQRLGDISTDKDPDGVLRRAHAFRTFYALHSTMERLAEQHDFDLSKTIVRPGQSVTLMPSEGKGMEIPLQADNTYDVGVFKSRLPNERGAPPGVMLGKAFREVTVWHMGIVMAAAQLGLDLDRAKVDPARGVIFLPGTNGVDRTIPVDKGGFFYVDWSIKHDDARLTRENFTGVLAKERMRRLGKPKDEDERWKDKILIVGSTATGNDLTDRGATPIQGDAYLVGKHWNVANSVIMDRYITRSPLWLDLLAVVLMGTLAAGLTWRLRAPWPTLVVIVIVVAYGLLARSLFVEFRYWIPMALPLLGALLGNHVALLTYNIVFEQREKRRVTGVFAKLVSPNVVSQLLQRDVIKLEGTREHITVFFSDVRGFTKLTDVNQTRAETYVRNHQLTGAAAEAHFDETAKDTLNTVNLYLSAIADQIKKHNGTLDKYIGDCVMAFWGAPTPNPQHAVACVRAAMDAQIAMHLLNLDRVAKNRQREGENLRRVAAGQELLHPLPILALGTGINSGTAIVGMMGSEAHIINYTVFGREVNLASRLEGVSGHSRIIIGEATFRELEKYDLELGALCVELEPVTPKGFAMPVRIWEVPWKKFLPPGTGELPSAEPAAAKPDAH